jgi:hypothetical protein
MSEDRGPWAPKPPIRKRHPIAHAIAWTLVVGLIYIAFTLGLALLRWSWHFAGMISP